MRDPIRREALEIVAGLDLPDCWIAAGFVRDALWDHAHGHRPRAPFGDVDVVWFGGAARDEGFDGGVEAALLGQFPALRWSVKNQARMHHRNGDRAYTSVADAMRHWPETATAIAARIGEGGAIEINAPFGTDDLFALRLRPTPAFAGDKLPIFHQRVASKRWIERYPRLSLAGIVAATHGS